MGERLQDADLSNLIDQLADALDRPRADVAAALSKALESNARPLQAAWPPEVEAR